MLNRIVDTANKGLVYVNVSCKIPPAQFLLEVKQHFHRLQVTSAITGHYTGSFNTYSACKSAESWNLHPLFHW